MANSEYTPTDEEVVSWQFDEVTGKHWTVINTDQLAAHCARVRAEERERCARIIESLPTTTAGVMRQTHLEPHPTAIAAGIRALSDEVQP